MLIRDIKHTNHLRYFIYLLYLFLVIILPNDKSNLNSSPYLVFPIELFIMLCFLLISGSLGRLVFILIGILFNIALLFKLFDFGSLLAFDRQFNPVIDFRWFSDGFNLLEGNLGVWGASISSLLIIGFFVLFFVFNFKLIKSIRLYLFESKPKSLVYLRTALLFCFIIKISFPGYAGYPLFTQLYNHIQQSVSAVSDLQRFTSQLTSTKTLDIPSERLFSKIKGKDVLICFVESYGKTVLDNPEYSPQIRTLLSQAETDLKHNGLSTRSAFLLSPTYGGISWLAHSTLMSGLWVDSQLRYDLLTSSTRPTLNRFFHDAGWRTLAVQPAHTMEWPQGDYFGYDKTYSAKDLDYQGLPFNWITMPDQFTLARLHELELSTDSRKPVMAEIALISSHAPWTPLPDLVAWEQVGNGNIFNSARKGDLAHNVWQDTDKIRLQYKKSIEYVLNTLVSFVLNHDNQNLVLIILGDHQPASFVSDYATSHDVPVHIITRDDSLFSDFDAVYWSAGLLPDPNHQSLGMDGFHDFLLRVFSD